MPFAYAGGTDTEDPGKLRAAFFILSKHCIYCIFFFMLDQQKISIGRIRQAYGLTTSEIENIIQKLWPDEIFPAELWRVAFETYWKSFVSSYQSIYKIEMPELPQPNMADRQFQIYLFAHDIQLFFSKISLIIPTSATKSGLGYILTEAYDDASTIFSDERKSLFDDLKKLDENDFINQYNPESILIDEPVFTIPASSYHFISHIFVDTILVNRERIVKIILSDYPLRKEVKGITHVFVKSILTTVSPKREINSEIINPETESVPSLLQDVSRIQAEAATVEAGADGKLTFHIPPSVWLGKPEHAVCDAMKDTYPLPVIAYVLFNWCDSGKSTPDHTDVQIEM